MSDEELISLARLIWPYWADLSMCVHDNGIMLSPESHRETVFRVGPREDLEKFLTLMAQPEHLAPGGEP